MPRSWTNDTGLAISAANLNALEADVTTALGVPDSALAGRVVAGATKTALDGAYATKAQLNGKEPTLPLGTAAQYFKGDKTLGTLDKNAVGLGNVDNTADLDKPVSNAVQAALNTIVTGEAQIWAGWRNACAKMSTKTVEWYGIGDSNTEGTGVTAHSATWLYKAAAKIRDSFPDIGANAKDSLGWVPIQQTSTTMVSPFTITGTSVNTSTFGFRRTRSIQLTGAGAYIQGTVTGTAVDIWYTQGTGTAAFTVQVDGGTGVSVGGSSASTTDGFVQRISLGASGSHTVKITRGTADCYITGITVYDGNENAGLVTINGGWHGSSTTNWTNSVGLANWLQNVTTLNPDLVTIMLSTNDYALTMGRATFSTNIKNLVGYIRDNVAGWPTILLISPWKQSATYTPAWEHYEYGLERAAAEIGCAYLDLRPKMPDIGTAEATASGYYYDSTHVNTTGAEKVATEVANLLIARSV